MEPSNESDVATDQPTTTRRTFFKTAIGVVGTAIAAALGIPAIAYIGSPAFKKAASEWIAVGPVRKVQIGVPTLFKAKIVHKQGWEETVSDEMMYVITDDGQHFVALSNVCTHLGCRVHWNSDKQEFICPCHNGVFDKQGNVVAGPPPRPLNRFQSKVENGKLWILES